MTKFASIALLVVLFVATSCAKPSVYEVPNVDSTNPTNVIAEGEYNPSNPGNAGDELIDPMPTDEPAEAPTPEPLRLSITATNFAYAPNAISAQVGQEVIISITNTGAHDFVIDELGIKQTLANGANTVRFTPTKAGTYEFYCSTGNHRNMGMKGTLTVS